MRVYIEQTTQKNIMKFVCDEVITSGSAEYSSAQDAVDSPLTQQLFQFPFVEKVFITANFVAVQKSDTVDWDDVANPLKEMVNEYLEKGQIMKIEKKEEPYTLYAEMTPNPLVMKFVANQFIVGKMIEVKERAHATEVPLALALYDAFPFVKEVFIQDNFLSVTRDESVEWQDYALEVRQFLLEYLRAGKEIVTSKYVPYVSQIVEELKQKTYTNVEQEIQKILDEYIQPAVANDGGNIALISFDTDTKTAKMLLQGACSGCPSSTVTLKNGIETILKQMMPNVVENVEAVNG